MGVGVAAMKPFAAGELLKAGKTAKIASYKTGWKTITMKVPEEANPTKLLNYTLSQPGVCTAVTGISSSDELSSNLEYLQSSNDEKDYQHILATIEMENA
jgi:predicted aldo/keto reductase-like oxidoreductase